MKTFVATLTTVLLFAAFSGIVTAQEAEQKTEEQRMQMPMMQGMMGGQGGMMQGGMMCPMFSHMMKGGMMGGQGGMMGQMPMMQPMMGEMHKMPTPEMLLSLADELKLEEDQVKSIQKIGFALQKEVIQRGAERSIAELELNVLLGEDEVDLQKAQEKIQQIASLEGDLKIAQIKASIDAKNVLTVEQSAKLKEIAKKKRAMHHPKKAGKELMH